MITIKSYSDLEQSKKLAEILPLESADGGWYGTTNPDAANTHFWLGTKYSKGARFPAWSLSALLDVLPNGIVMNKDSQTGRYHFSSRYIETYVSADNPIEACVAMIEKLHELNLP